MFSFPIGSHYARKNLTEARLWTMAGLFGTGVVALLFLADGPPTDLATAAQYLVAGAATGMLAVLLLFDFANVQMLGRKHSSVDIDQRYWRLQQAAGVTDELFLAWYLPFLCDSSNEQLIHITHALRRRSSRLLGSENGQEIARQQRDRWTYAVFVVASLTINSATNRNSYKKDTRLVRDLRLLLETMPDSARTWLFTYPDISESIIEALLFRSNDNPVWNLITPVSVPECAHGTPPSNTSSISDDTCVAKEQTAPRSNFKSLGLLRTKR